MLRSETTGEETLRYYYDSTGKIAEIVYKKGESTETGYFFARNAQGDIIAIYRSSDSKLMGTYEYDLWGKLVNITPTVDDTDGITVVGENVCIVGCFIAGILIKTEGGNRKK